MGGLDHNLNEHATEIVPLAQSNTHVNILTLQLLKKLLGH